MEIIQSTGKPIWVRNGRDLANHFLEIIDNSSKECQEVQVIFDRYDIPNSLNERTHQFRQGSSRPMVCHISDDAVIEKITLKQLLSSNINEESLAIYFASHILQCNTDSRKTYVVTTKGECKSSKLSVEHISSTQEEADTLMILHAIDATGRGATSLCIQSPDTYVLVLALGKYTSLCEEPSLLLGTGAKCRLILLRPLYNALGHHVVQHYLVSAHSLAVSKRAPYVESQKFRAGIP